MSNRRADRRFVGALLGALLLALLAWAAPASAEAPAVPHWQLEARPAPTNLPLKGEAALVVTAGNVGDAAAQGENGKPIRVIDTLPAGMEATGTRQAGDFGGTPRYTGEGGNAEFFCTITPPSVVECTFPHALDPFEQLQFEITLKTNYATPSKLQNHLSVSEAGSSTPAAEANRELSVNDEPTLFGVEPGGFAMAVENEEFGAETQSGSHPFQLTTTVNFNQTYTSNATGRPVQPSAPTLAKNLSFRLPAGLLGNPTAMPQCTDFAFGAHEENNLNTCPEDTVIGVADVSYNNASVPNLEFASQAVPVFNLEPGASEPARFGFEIFHVPIILNTSIRTGEDYGATIEVLNASSAVQVLGTRLTIWGTPNDPRHDNARGWACLGGGSYTAFIKPTPPVCGAHAAHNEKAFLTLPTTCGTQQTVGGGEAWDGSVLPQVTTQFTLSGCGQLPFSPTVEVKTDTHAASTPTGLTVELNLPQQGTLTKHGLAEADMKNFTLELPKGLTTSSGAANNLIACGAKQVEFFGLDTDNGDVLGSELESQHFSFKPPTEREEGKEPTCPDAAKLGTVEINTPFLAKPVVGSVYLASQDTNPFAPRLVLYLIAEEPESKVLVKLAGEVEITPEGNLISRFKNSPQTPFEHLKLHLFNGSSSGSETAAQATPSRCSTTAYSATGKFTTWSEAPGEPEPTAEATTNPAGSAITSGPHGTPCTEPGQALPFGPGFQAGAANAEAGKFSPFTLTIARPDGNQALRTVGVVLPPGAAAMLASVTPCPEPAAWNGTCGPESLIGHSTAYSGLGNAPFALPGNVYLTGPYNGAPFGLSVVTSAQSVGPFNIGTIVARSSINVDPTTAQAKIDTEATRVYPSTGGVEEYAGLPEIIKGLPAQIKQLDVTVDRPEFEFNPTNCNAMAVTGTLTGTEGAAAGVSSPFKVTNCGALPFKPTISVETEKEFSRVDGLGIKIVVKSSKGQANIHKTKLVFPTSLPSRLTTIQKACDDKIFDVNPANCPEGSVIGSAIAHTPVLKKPLEGPAYLVSHANASFPDAEFVLQGEGIKLVLDGKTNIKNGITSSTFETVPDAPVETFEVNLPRGPHSAFSGFGNLCAAQQLPTEFGGQNGALLTQTTTAVVKGCSGVLPSKAKKESELQKLLKKCKKLKNHKKRVKCEATARKQVKAVASCKAKNKKNKKKQNQCVAKARKTYALKLK
jgi:hypothetical protein